MNGSSLLAKCWQHQSCDSCLHDQNLCSWCAASSTCVANPTRWQLIAPIFHPKICPLKEERWELRAKGLGCGVSTVTLMSVIIAIIGVILAALAIWVLLLLFRWIRRSQRRLRIGLRPWFTTYPKTWSRNLLQRKSKDLRTGNLPDERQPYDDRAQLLG